MATDASFFLRRDTGMNTWSPQFIADPGVDALFYLVNSTGLFAAMNLPIAATFGGTGFDSYVVGDLLYASTTSALSKLADIATGNALISGGIGVAPSWGKIGLTTHVSGILPAPNGGTGQSSYAVGDLLYANTTTTLAKLADTATGNALLAGGIGVAPAWGKVTPSHFSGVLLVANGGTGLSTIASGKLLYASALDTLAPLSIGTSLAITAGTLNTIQGIRTVDTPQWTRVGIGVAADSVAVLNLNGKLITPTSPPAQNYGAAYDDYHHLIAIGTPHSGGASNPVGLRIDHEIIGANGWTEAVGAWIELQLTGSAGTGRVIGVDGFGILAGTGMAATQWSSFNAGVRVSGSGSITTEYNGFLADFTEVTGAGDITGKIAGLRVRTGFGRAAASQVNGVYVDSLTASGSGRTAAIEANQTAAIDSYNIYMASTAINRLNGQLQMVSADIVAGDNGGAATWQGQAGLVGRGIYVQRAGSNSGLHALAVGSVNALCDLSQARGAYGALTATQAGDTLIHMGRFYDGSNWFQAARIDFIADENASSTNRGTNIQFKTIVSGTTILDTRMQLSGLGSILLGKQTALTTTATDGFVYIPGCAGAPTGTATGVTGLVPCVLDTVNSKIMFYFGGVWKGVTLT